MNTEQLKQIIYDEACEYFGRNLKSKRRFKEIVEARRFTIAYILDNCGCSLKEVGALFDNRDHSTIIHARDDHEFKISKYREDWQRWDKFRRHMDTYLMTEKGKRFAKKFVFELDDDVATQKAYDLFEAGGLDDFIQHQLIAL